MSDDLVKQSIAELQDLVRCQCDEAYKDRGLHDPTCCCDYAEAVKVVADRIEELEAQVRAADALADAGSVMARALHGDYIVPGSATKWDAALAAYRATKEGGA